MADFASTIGNSPVRKIPVDYFPDGATAAWFVLERGIDQGKKLFFYDITLGDGPVDATIVFVHGNPESSYTYRKTVECLLAQNQQCIRVIAMDHIGFGLSDQASIEMVDIHHAGNLGQLVDALQLSNVTLVIHDWGGPIGIGCFIERPTLVSNIVLMNTTVFPVPISGMTYANFPIPFVLPWFYLGHVVPWQVWSYVAALVMSSRAGKWNFIKHSANFIYRALRKQLTSQEQFYQQSFSTKPNAMSSKRNVKQTKYWGHGFSYHVAGQKRVDNHAFYQHIQQQIHHLWGPQGQNIGVRGFFGLWDPLARPEVSLQWGIALPQIQGHITTFKHTGHFVEEVKFEEISQGILSVIQHK